MSEPLRILMLEDSRTDAELNERILHKAGIDFSARLVDGREAFIEALKNFKPDLILADYHLAGFDGLQALMIARDLAPNAPYIFVTGAMGEENAVETLKLGAVDYILKDRLTRLPSAVQRALEERLQREKRREAEERFRVAAETARDAIVVVESENGTITFWNRAAETIFGYTKEEALGQNIHDLIVPRRFRDDCIKGMQIFQITGEGAAIGKTLELIALHKNGTEFPIELSLSAMKLEGKWHATGIARDITERKRSDKLLRESEERYHHLFESMGSGVIIFQPDDIGEVFTIKSANRAVESIERLSRKDMIGRSVEEAFPGVRDLGLYDLFRRVLETGKPEHLPPAYYKDDRITGWREYFVYLLDTGELISVYDDVSDRVEREKQIRRLNHILLTISACNDELVHAGSEKELLENVCRRIVEIGGHLLAIVTYREGIDELPAVHFGNEEILNAYISLMKDPALKRTGLTESCMRERRTKGCPRIMMSPECVFGDLKKLGIKSILALPLINDDRLYGAITMFSDDIEAFDEAEVSIMEELAADLAYGMDALRTSVERDLYMNRLGESMKNTVMAIARTLEMRDPYTAGHQQRVTMLAVSIATVMGLNKDLIEGLYFGAMIHDIGKIAVPAEILSKPSRLSELEYEMIKVHPTAGYDIVQEIKFPWPVPEMILQHHERLNGTGYPKGLKREEIILEARIIAVADVVEAMTTHRPYRPALGIDAAIEEVELGKGTLFDPEVVEACRILFKEKGYSLM